MDPGQQNVFWKLLEKAKGIELPVYVKNILDMNSFNHPIVFQGINEKVIDELESFARETMRELLDEDVDLKLFYGMFHKTPQKFKFAMGDRHLLVNLVQFVKEKDPDYWESMTDASKILISNTIPVQQKSSLSKVITPDLPESNVKMEVEEVTKILTKMLRSSNDKEKKLTIMKKENEELRSEGPISVRQLNVQVSVKEIYGEDGLPLSFTYIAQMTCYICKKKVSITKTAPTENRKSRWVLTNFIRHIDTHSESHQLKKQKPGRKRSNQSSLDLFCTPGKMQKLEDSAVIPLTEESPDDPSAPTTQKLQKSMISVTDEPGGDTPISTSPKLRKSEGSAINSVIGKPAECLPAYTPTQQTLTPTSSGIFINNFTFQLPTYVHIILIHRPVFFFRYV